MVFLTKKIAALLFSRKISITHCLYPIMYPFFWNKLFTCLSIKWVYCGNIFLTISFMEKFTMHTPCFYPSKSTSIGQILIIFQFISTSRTILFILKQPIVKEIVTVLTIRRQRKTPDNLGVSCFFYLKFTIFFSSVNLIF